jgi:hypothetical protein
MMQGNGRLRAFLNLMTLQGLPKREFCELRQAGFEGVQFAERAASSELAQCTAAGLRMAASGRVNRPDEAAELARTWAGDGYECATLHVGWGLEDDDEALRLIHSVIVASARWKIPMFIETHRATICQDLWRTVQFVRRFPEMRFNGDFSHWYTGQEMVYGGFEKKVAFIRPVIERVGFIHGRIGNPGCIQVRVDEESPAEPIYVTHFKQLWTACFAEFLAKAENGDSIYFAPELLAPDIFYARTFPNASGEMVEESDRWEQSLVLKRMAESCFEQAGNA